ncbi:MAG: segregation ATPase FtsK/SpoIIIE, family, partial [Sphingomonadales bacterium]|nr:segregation ATPase FtsK/SpoIIIE, family [Sphingomonadales bacterium]
AVLPAARLGARPWSLPIGIGERDLRPTALALYEGEHALIAGPGRSGRSTALCALASRAHAAGAVVLAVAGSRSPLATDEHIDRCFAPDDVTEAVAEVAPRAAPVLLLIDDAEGVADPTGVLGALLDERHAHLAVIAAGRADALRTAYGHWTRQLRRSQVGLLLAPDVDLDGELVGVALPRRASVALGAGRGWLVVGGEVQVVQVAT